MHTLVINVPKYQETVNHKKSFDAVLKTCIGKGYAINKKLNSLICEGCDVVVLSKDQGASSRREAC